MNKMLIYELHLTPNFESTKFKKINAQINIIRMQILPISSTLI